jgi:glycosyltransferase involved in cell wall biosynthesis
VAVPSPRDCAFVVPGDWHAPTGGYRYDRRIVEELRAAGWRVQTVFLSDAFPWPDAAACADARRRIEGLADGLRVVVDGLAFGVLPQLARQHGARLRWVALVHHPLHLETGLEAMQRARLHHDEQRALSAARQVVVTSRATAVDLAALSVPPARIAVVEPGTDTVAPRAPQRSEGALQLLCVATLTARKGHAVLLEALAGLKQLQWSLHLVGSATRDPATAQQLRNASTALGLAQRVHWHGEVDETSLSAHYAAADLFVLPSYHEGYGMAVAEALAHGLPVVATDAGALPQTLPHAAGRLVPPGDAAALRAALLALLADPGARAACARAARSAARQLPSWAQAAARFASVLEAVP